MNGSFSLSILDIGVITTYVGGLMLIGLWHRTARSTAQGHFLGGHSASWPRIGFSLYASTIGVTSLVGLSGSAYAHGISVFAYEWMAALVLPVFCAFILPTYLRSKVFTVPEFLEKRFGRFVRTYVSGLSILLDIFLEGAGGLFGGAILLQVLVPTWSLWMICSTLALLAGVFQLAGGLRSVMLVEGIQGIIIVSLCASLAWLTFNAAGGWSHVFQTIDPSRLKLIMAADDPNMPWVGLLTGVPLIGFYYWCTNQTMVQRVLAAKSLDHGRWGSLLGGALKLTNLFLVILPGAAAVLIYPELSAADQVFPLLVFDLLPKGILGLMLAACLVSILSSLASVYNATSTLLTMDFIRRMKPELTDKQLVRVGRLVTIGLMAISILWAPQIGNFHDTLWQYLQAILSYFVPPIAAVFVAGFFFRQANAAGAATGLVVGTTMSFVGFFGIEVFRIIPLHFQIAAILIFVAALFGVFCGSLIALGKQNEKIKYLMFSMKGWRSEGEALKLVPFYKNYRFLSISLIVLTLGIVFCFR